MDCRRMCHRRSTWGRHCRSRGSWRRRMQRGAPLRCLGRCFFRGALGLGGSFSVGDALQVLPDFFRNIGGDGTGMRFLFGNAESRKKVDDGFGLDLEFAGELVDADLGCVTHAALGTFLFLLFRRSLRFRGRSSRGGSLGGRFFGFGYFFGGRLGRGFGGGSAARRSCAFGF